MREDGPRDTPWSRCVPEPGVVQRPFQSRERSPVWAVSAFRSGSEFPVAIAFRFEFTRRWRQAASVLHPLPWRAWWPRAPANTVVFQAHE